MKQSKLSPITIDRAVELYALTPNAVHKEIAEELGISSKQLLKLRREPKFWADVYDRYMITFEGDIPDVLRATVREAKAGNVQAQRLVLEHSGKLQKHLSITIKSPWELWVASKNNQLEPSQEISRNKSSMIRTWTDYCQEIGSSRQVVNRWLARAGYLAIARQKNEAEAVEAVEKASTGEVVLNGEPPLVEVRNGRPNKPNNAGDRANCAGQTRRRADGRGSRKRL